MEVKKDMYLIHEHQLKQYIASSVNEHELFKVVDPCENKRLLKENKLTNAGEVDLNDYGFEKVLVHNNKIRNFFFEKHFYKFAQKYEWFNIDNTRSRSTELTALEIGGYVWEDGLLSISLQDKLGFDEVKTLEQCTKLHKYFDYCDKQYRDRNEFLSEVL